MRIVKRGNMHVVVDDTPTGTRDIVYGTLFQCDQYVRNHEPKPTRPKVGDVVRMENSRGVATHEGIVTGVGSDYYTARFETYGGREIRVDAESIAYYLTTYKTRFVRSRSK
jgi:hypothetical protein